MSLYCVFGKRCHKWEVRQKREVGKKGMFSGDGQLRASTEPPLKEVGWGVYTPHQSTVEGCSWEGVNSLALGPNAAKGPQVRHADTGRWRPRGVYRTVRVGDLNRAPTVSAILSKSARDTQSPISTASLKGQGQGQCPACSCVHHPCPWSSSSQRQCHKAWRQLHSHRVST